MAVNHNRKYDFRMHLGYYKNIFLYNLNIHSKGLNPRPGIRIEGFFESLYQ